MKSILACLLGLSLISYAEDDGEQFSWDSAEEGSRTYDGIVVQVYKPADGEPVITLGTDLDDHEQTYCLTLMGLFEAENYDLTLVTSTDDDYAVVDDSFVDLAEANCTVSETSTTTFTIDCNDINGGDLDFNFAFTTNDDGNEGLEYSIQLEDYTFVSDSSLAQLVIVQSVEDCSDLYEYSADSGDDSDDTDNYDNDDDETTLEPNTRRRRLLHGEDLDVDTDTDEANTDDGSVEGEESNSIDEPDGMSSDDSNEYDAGFVQYIVTGQAVDICDDGQENVNSSLIYQVEDEQLHIVFDHFDCTLFIDPSFAIDKTKIDAAHSISVMVGLMIGVIASLLF